jgi:hypothetical protein
MSSASCVLHPSSNQLTGPTTCKASRNTVRYLVSTLYPSRELMELNQDISSTSSLGRRMRLVSGKSGPDDVAHASDGNLRRVHARQWDGVFDERSGFKHTR